jgi:hypothetical protein
MDDGRPEHKVALARGASAVAVRCDQRDEEYGFSDEDRAQRRSLRPEFEAVS